MGASAHSRPPVSVTLWPVRIEVTGAWTELEVVALTALMTRRHRRMVLMIAVVGTTGDGPVD
jgi:hypothetical protein